MGDHRAHIRIELTMYGKTERGELSINWLPNSEGIDERVVEWFAHATRRFRVQAEAERDRLEREKEALEERKLYEYLKAKYEGG